MSESGYTLAETLAAMAILGLATAGLSLGLQIVSRLQFSVTDSIASSTQHRSFQTRLSDLLARGGAFGSAEPERMTGDAQEIEFACGGSQNCHALLGDNEMTLIDAGGDARSLKLKASEQHRFAYEGRLSSSDVWPPQEPARQNLKTVSLLARSGDGEHVVLSVRVWGEQPADCAYDPVIGGLPMTVHKNLEAEVVDEAAGAAPAQPQVFVRVYATPPGMPWEQSRAAGLEARHGAPLPVVDLMLKVKRLEPWRPGAPGRYGAFYIRIREYVAPFEASVEVDGKAHKIAFGANAEHAIRMKKLLLGGGLGVAAALVCALGLSLASTVRAEGETRLENLEQQSAQRLKAAKAFQLQKDLARELDAASAKSGRLDDVLGELAWVATSKSPDVQIVAVHWESGVLAVEARGEAAPFTAPDRRIERFDKPLRPGVWLWGVGPRGSGEVREIGP